ncbi:hypothetical protein [Nocardioides rubriscoriae]|uniref:hypothetical protein n=1 Tax=Nocardioides rubriscoriae TaxID=642762 RepID=UPI0011E014EE|nr:hypothetical protein [Nocardioides rubriscoriae]
MDLLVGAACLLVPLAFIALVVVAIVASVRARQRRMDTLASYAAQREWRYRPDGTGLEDRFPGDPFGRGHARSATNVVEGTYEGRAFLAFDYHYTTGSGDDSTRHGCSVVTMHLGGLRQPVPMLQVAPTRGLAKFFHGLLGHDLAIGDPVFDDLFLVRTDSPELARDVLHPDLRAMLAAYQDRAWRLQGDSLLMFRSGQHSPGEIDAVLASMKAILDRVPPVVWQRLGGGEAPR